MTQDNPIFDLIKRWPNRREFAVDVGADVQLVHKWAKSGRIPSDWQLATLLAATKRGFEDVTASWMLSVHAGQHNASPKQDAVHDCVPEGPLAAGTPTPKTEGAQV